MLGLFNNQQGSKIWKRFLSENMHKKNMDSSILTEALKLLPEDVLDNAN
jgi:tRNA-dihydrouridine synthase A